MKADTDEAVRIAGFEFSVQDVTKRTWRFGRPGAARAYAPHLKLLADGRLGGHVVETEWTWALEAGVIVFFDRLGRRSTRFDRAYVRPDGRFLLQGELLLAAPGSAVHELQEISPVQRSRRSTDGMKMMFRPSAGARPNLLVVHANEASLHPRWARDIGEADRNWDLCIGFYGEEDNFGRDEVAEIQVLGNRERKFARMHRMFADDSPLWRYDYVCFADDDVMTSWGDVNELFVICRQFRLQLAQPSLTPDSQILHPITRRQEDRLLRYVSFVQSMMPIFSRDALRACIVTMDVDTVGKGLDNVWPKLIGDPMKAMAVIDRVSVVHTRPIHVHDDELQNGGAFQNLYDAPTRMLEFGAIYETPIGRGSASPPVYNLASDR